MQFVTIGRRPDRLESPIIVDKTWDLIQTCWEAEASRRPTMKDIMAAITRWLELENYIPLYQFEIRNVQL